MSYVKPNDERARYAILLLKIVMVLTITSLASSLLQLNLLNNAANGIEISTENAKINDMREWIVGIVYLVAYIISIVTFILWFRRAYYNLHQRVENLDQKDRMATISWFIPIVNLFGPYQIMKELYYRTQILFDSNDINQHQNLGTRYVRLWWALWIITGILGRVIAAQSRNATSITDLTNGTILDITQSILGIPLALLAIKVVKDYAKVEPILASMKNDYSFRIATLDSNILDNDLDPN
ncbi:MAG: DUF4328 domain-containing protein [Bacteroidetes bacterium]|nr:DUF4328 domain-containing protein [Bacteroidota bacterium]